MVLGTRRGLALVLAIGILGTGLVVATISAAGYGTVASLVWVAGYGLTVLVLWYGWVRPVDFGSEDGGPDVEADSPDETPESSRP